MPQVEILIGGRSFEVACQEGEEPYLQSAAAMLDTEAQALSSQIGRMPEGRMLLMAGLMLADKTAGLEERLREAEATIAALQAEAAAGALPPEVLDAMAEVAAQAEWVAQRVTEKAGG
jgi:cell division protein ZapA